MLADRVRMVKMVGDSTVAIQIIADWLNTSFGNVAIMLDGVPISSANDTLYVPLGTLVEVTVTHRKDMWTIIRRNNVEVVVGSDPITYSFYVNNDISMVLRSGMENTSCDIFDL